MAPHRTIQVQVKKKIPFKSAVSHPFFWLHLKGAVHFLGTNTRFLEFYIHVLCIVSISLLDSRFVRKLLFIIWKYCLCLLIYLCRQCGMTGRTIKYSWLKVQPCWLSSNKISHPASVWALCSMKQAQISHWASYGNMWIGGDKVAMILVYSTYFLWYFYSVVGNWIFI